MTHKFYNLLYKMGIEKAQQAAYIQKCKDVKTKYPKRA